ncbi:DUF5083 family protein [Staphylococcus warneri]|uniref:DUF5083 domain-containing protein n=4 Tax=Staphylococcus warneri TaxID=1292 RepID=A0A364UPB8_STAWA|nr:MULTISPECIES: DUF5083 family protein [Staphylococcus]AGC89500.1 hypothetical protein A284_00845 [Staphylococcus warneri SG1]PAK72540.1 DUF5083 domain-containing protein [Staphylococcus pasteuri]EGG96578.1 hypothetical protein SEVCU121_0979 [Staphylococcus warneri VCU121]KEK49862.1 hypothetical protein AQ02_0315 [Staphylococcus warneri Lyso 1 2011]KEK56450.1 hypothetical protein AQ03_0274 [Staphylococcus warneri Lyso 2 2011]
MKNIKKINKMFLSFEIIPFIMSVLLMFAPMFASIINNRLQYGRDFSDKVALYSYISIMSVYVITILLEIIFYFKILKNYQYDQTNVELSNRVKVTKVLSILYMIPGLYAIPFYFRFLHVRSFRENKKSGQPAYHFWEYFIKPDRKPFELKDLFIKNR